MGKKLFGLERTSEGTAFEQRVANARRASKAQTFPSKDNSFNSKDKKGV